MLNSTYLVSNYLVSLLLAGLEVKFPPFPLLKEWKGVLIGFTNAMLLLSGIVLAQLSVVTVSSTSLIGSFDAGDKNQR